MFRLERSDNPRLEQSERNTGHEKSNAEALLFDLFSNLTG
jgi:hypothetical protein